MPVIPAMLVAAVLVGFVGAFTGYSALRRRGLFREEYEGTTLRDHLGLRRPQPVQRAAAVAAE